MKVLVEGKLYDSNKTPILLVFEDREKDFFNLNRYVSAPETSTVEEREELINTEIEKYS